VRHYDAMHGAANLHNIVQYLRADGSLNWSIVDHYSMRNDDETFVVGSTYGGDGTWGAFEKEIYLAYTDGSGFVRLAHSRSQEAQPDPNVRYFADPRAVVDRFGRYVVYSSDLGSPSRIDVMMLLIPPEYRPASPGGGSGGAPTGSAQDAAAPAHGCSLARGRGPAGAASAVVPALALLIAIGLRRQRRRARTG
jgi:hypothetical protein